MIENKTKYLNPEGLFDPTPFGFCHSVQLPAHSNLLFISGQSGGVGESHLLADDFFGQAKSALENLKLVLDANGSKPENIIKITVLIVDHSEEKLKIWTTLARDFWQGYNLPTSTLIPVPMLALPGMQIEVDAIAFV